MFCGHIIFQTNKGQGRYEFVERQFYKHAMERLSFLGPDGNKVNSVWKCECHQQMMENVVIKQFVLSRSLPFYVSG